MWFHSKPDHQTSISLRRRPVWALTRSPNRQKSVKLFVEVLEARTLLSVAPVPLPLARPNPFGGPIIHLNAPGPADAPPPVGNDPSGITDFDGFIGRLRVSGTGQDIDGNALLWESDLGFMQGAYRGVDGQLHHGTFAFV